MARRVLAAFAHGKDTMHKLVISLAVSLAGLAACKGGSNNSNAKPAEAIACPASYSKLPAGTHACQCDGLATQKGAVWGAGPYTQDSSICRAALHAGVIPPTGGRVELVDVNGCDHFASTFANNVTSSEWGSYPSAFTFAGKPTSCAAPAAAAAPCPATYGQLPEPNAGGEKTCACTAEQTKGSVWGTGPYTQDSSICGAAVHAGVIPASGGTVRVIPTPGCQSFKGDTRNGITTQGWGSYPNSFSFVGGDPSCK